MAKKNKKVKPKTQKLLRKVATAGLGMAILKGALTAAGGVIVKKVWV